MPGLGHQAVQRGGLIALVGELRQGGVQDPFLLVRRQLPESREGRFFTHDHLVISNPAGDCQALGRFSGPNSLDNSPPP